MSDDLQDVDYSIQLQPIRSTAQRSSRKRSPLLYLLVGGAVFLSLATVFAFVMRIVSLVREQNTPVAVAALLDPAAGRAEAVRVFSEFDAYEERIAKRSEAAQGERDAILAVLKRLEKYAANEDQEAFRKDFALDRLAKRIELTGALANYSALNKRMLRGQLHNSVDTEPTWAKLILAGVTAPADDPNTRVVYVFGKNAAGDDQASTRLWLAKDGETWKLYDWERFDMGMPESRRLSYYVKYDQSPLMKGHNRWAQLLQEAATLTATDDHEAAKEKLRQAELQTAPRELADLLWMWTGHHWLHLEEPKDAERCYQKIARPIDMPGVYLGLMNAHRRTNPVEAINDANLYEAATGPSPELLEDKAQLLKQLGRKQDAIAEFKKQLRIEPDNVDSLADLYLTLPNNDKSEFEEQLARIEKPVDAIENIAPRIGYRDYAGLTQLVAYSQRNSPEAPDTFYVTAYAHSLNGEHEAAAKLYRQAYEKETGEDERAGYGRAYVQEMAEIGQALAACELLADPKSAMASLFDDLNEDDITLTSEEERKLVERYRERYPNDLTGISRQLRMEMKHERYADVERLARAAIERTIDDPDIKGPNADQIKQSYQDSFDEQLAVARYRQGRLKEAYEGARKRDMRFNDLAQLARGEERWADVAALIALHRANNPQDSHLRSVEADVAIHNKRWDDAIRLLREAIATAPEQEKEFLQSRLRIVSADAGKWRELLGPNENEAATFEALANRFVQRKNWASLGDLIWEHGRYSNDESVTYEFVGDRAWADENWTQYVQAGEKALNSQRQKDSHWYKQYQAKSRMFSALLRSRNYDKAAEFARKQESGQERSNKLAVVSAARGDVAEANRLAREAALENDSANMFYSDDDVGRLFLGEQFRDLHREFPVDVPNQAVSLMAVFLLDEPWQPQAAEFTAALEQAGLKSLGLPRTTGSNPWLQHFDLEGATVWLAGGEGKFNDSWTTPDASSSLSQTISRRSGWIAAGTAGWTDPQREAIEAHARKIAAKLLAGRATALCLSEYGQHSNLTAFPANAELLAQWQTAGTAIKFDHDGLPLQEKNAPNEVAHNRQFDQSLMDAARRFEATPNSRLFIWTKLSEKPAFDELKLNVTAIKRRYGSFSFDGALSADSIILPELRTGLPMRWHQSEIKAWQLDDGPRIEREQ